MKLILASDYTFLLKYGYNLTGIPKDQMKIGYVNTAIQVEDDKDKEFIDKAKNIHFFAGLSDTWQSSIAGLLLYPLLQ
ncbi:MAG: hypothetical protein WCI93_04385, partial [bacterium]